ncbi:Uncharacterised protein [Candidatus Burarchaeum australiense]|nr:Uncharacterised protein [Candidatus Burarchaeum australiense]
MVEAFLKKEEEEKKKKEQEERQKAASTPFGPAQQAAKADAGGAPGAGPAAFHQARKDIFGDELIRDATSIEQRARSDYERAVAKEKEAIMKGGAGKVVRKEKRGDAKVKKKEPERKEEKPK